MGDARLFKCGCDSGPGQARDSRLGPTCVPNGRMGGSNAISRDLTLAEQARFARTVKRMTPQRRSSDPRLKPLARANPGLREGRQPGHPLPDKRLPSTGGLGQPAGTDDLNIDYDNRVQQNEAVEYGGEVWPFLLTGPEGCKVASYGDLDKLDPLIMAYMAEHRMPNGAVSVVSSDGRLVYCKAFTNLRVWEDEAFPTVRDNEGLFPAFRDVAAVPESLFRVGSVTKPVTATVVLHAIQQGYIGSLDDPFYDYLPAAIKSQINDVVNVPDPAQVRSLRKITIADLLRHSAGWCEKASDCSDIAPAADVAAGAARGVAHLHYDAMKNDVDVGLRTGWSLPLTQAEAYGYALGARGFANHNGSRYWHPSHSALLAMGQLHPHANATLREGGWHQYSNFGYNLLARVVEGATGWRNYHQFAMKKVLQPLRMANTVWATSRPSGRHPLEWVYLDRRDQGRRLELDFYGGEGRVPSTYGGDRRMEMVDGSGGMVSNVIDLARYLDAFRQTGPGPSVLNPASSCTLWVPSGPSGAYGLGWRRDDTGRAYSSGELQCDTTGRNQYPTYHGGLLEGTRAVIYRFNDTSNSPQPWGNAAFAAVFNRDVDATAATGSQILPILRSALAGRVTLSNQLAQPRITDWGRESQDLFDCDGSSRRPGFGMKL